MKKKRVEKKRVEKKRVEKKRVEKKRVEKKKVEKKRVVKKRAKRVMVPSQCLLLCSLWLQLSTSWHKVGFNSYCY